MLPCEGITTFHQKRCGSLLHLQELKFKNNNINVQILFVRRFLAGGTPALHTARLSLSHPFPAKEYGCKH